MNYKASQRKEAAIGNVPKVDVYIGESIEHPSEQRFLRRVLADLKEARISAVILANLVVRTAYGSRQIDFVIATEAAACVVEVKGFRRPVRGGFNGVWEEVAGDKISWKPLDGQNPYRQALEARFAVSDALAELGVEIAPGRKHYESLHGMLCCYPEPPYSSNLPPGDQKVSIGGYKSLRLLLSVPTPAPAFGLETWRAIATAFNLRPLNYDRVTEEELQIASYVKLHRDLIERELGPYVPLTIEAEQDQLTIADLRSMILDGQDLAVVGPSGSGKSHLLSHLILQLTDEGLVPIGIRAADFRGKLGALLQQTIAAATPIRPVSLFKACLKAGRVPVLVVDAINECPDTYHENLLRSLQALQLRYSCRIIISDQVARRLPSAFCPREIKLFAPDQREKQALLWAYAGISSSAATAAAMEIASTAHDIMVLAEVIGNASTATSRYTLYEAFIRKRLGDSPDATVAYRGLARLATAMRTKFLFSVTHADMQRVFARVAGNIAHEGNVYEVVRRSGLVDFSGERVSFKHELFQNFFASEELLLNTPDAIELSRALLTPIYGELAEFALGSLTSSIDIDIVLGAVTSSEVLADAFLGRCGPAVRQTIIDRCSSAISALGQRYAALAIQYKAEDSRLGRFSPVTVRATNAPELSPSDHAYLRFVSLCTRDDVLFQLFIDMLGKVDSMIDREVARLRAEHPDRRIAWRSATFAALYISPLYSDARELSDIFQRHHTRTASREDEAYFRVARALMTPDTFSLGQLYFLLENCRPPSSLAEASYDIRSIAQMGWRSGVYHVRFAVADFLQWHARLLSDAARKELGELAQTWLTDRDAFLNSIVIDILKALDALGDDMSIDEVRAEFTEVMSMSEGPDANQRAYSFYTSAYDHPYDHLYQEVIYNLPKDQRNALFVRALNSSQKSSMFFSFVVNDIARDPIREAAPVLQRLARIPETDTASMQDSVRTFTAAIKALARMRVPLEEDVAEDIDSASRAYIAWRCAARILYLFYQQGISQTEFLAQSSEDWDQFIKLHPASLDVFIRLASEWRDNYTEDGPQILDWSRNFVLELSRRALSRIEEPETLFTRQHYFKEIQSEQIGFCLQVIGLYGNRSDLPTLSNWISDPAHGRSAINAARQIESGQAS